MSDTKHPILQNTQNYPHFRSFILQNQNVLCFLHDHPLLPKENGLEMTIPVMIEHVKEWDEQGRQVAKIIYDMIHAEILARDASFDVPDIDKF